jgi:hypothetical protein
MQLASRRVAQVVAMSLAVAMPALAAHEAPAGLPSVEVARKVLKPPFGEPAIDLLAEISEAGDRKDEWLPLLRDLLAQPLSEDDASEVAYTLIFLVGDAQIAAWLDGDAADHDLAVRLIPFLARSASDWMCRGLPDEHAALHAGLIHQLERRDGARREAVMDLLLKLDCQLGAVAEPLLRMLSDESEDRRAFARRSLLRCKGGTAWMRGSLTGADDVLAASLADPARREVVLELLASGSCRESPKLVAALEAELAHATDAERPSLEAALKQVEPRMPRRNPR